VTLDFPHPLYNTKFLERTNKTKCLRCRLFKPVVVIQNLGVQVRRATRKIYVIDHLRPGVFDVRVSVVESNLSGLGL